MAKNDFRVTLTIENLRKDTNYSMNLDFSSIQTMFQRMGMDSEDFGMLSTDIVFDADDLDSLESILEDIGIGISDVDPAVLNTH